MDTIKIRYTLKILLIIFLSIIAIVISVSSLYAWSGTILDNETSRPIEGAVIIRSWDREYPGPCGGFDSLATFKETLSDKDGNFNISIFKRLLHVSVPIFAPIRENKPIVFKPGYRFLEVSEKPSIIKLNKIPPTYYLRYEEAEKARGNNQVDFHETTLLKKIYEDEKESSKNLNKYVPGVLYTGFINPHDIAIDQENNVFVADGYRRTIQKLSQKEKPITISRGIQGGRIDIEIDRSGNLYYAKGGKLYNKNQTIIDFLLGDVRFVLGKRNRVFTIVAYKKPYLFSYDLQGKHLLCKQEVIDINSTPFEGNVTPIDITSAPDDKIIVAYSHYNPYRDGKRRKYVNRNSIQIFDQNCNKLLNKEIDIDSKVRSIATTPSGEVIVADENTINFFDKNFNFVFKEDLRGKELGIVDIHRISTDWNGTYLYIIEKRYQRILKYNIKTREFCIR